MAKRLTVLIGMLALMLATALSAAMAQEQEGQYADASQYETPEVSATGILRDGLPQDVGGDGTHSISDEATGELYGLRSASADLDTYTGQRVTIYGPLTPGEGGPVVDGLWSGTLPSIDVLRVQPLSVPGDPPPGGPTPSNATITYELAVECEPPADATLLGFTAGESLATTPLTDSDGDGLYTGSITVPKFAPGPVGPGTEPVSLPFRIVQGPPTGFSAIGPEYRVIKDFGLVSLDGDKTLSAGVSFCDGGTGDGSGNSNGGTGGAVVSGDTNNANKGGSGSVDASGGAGQDSSPIASVLPATGGILPVVAVAGALLIVGGLVARRIFG